MIKIIMRILVTTPLSEIMQLVSTNLNLDFSGVVDTLIITNKAILYDKSFYLIHVRL